jgi:caspase 7
MGIEGGIFFPKSEGNANDSPILNRIFLFAVEKSSHSRNKGESGETLICASSDEKISDHFPGGQGSCEVSHREGDVDQLDGSIMSRVRIFNALCTKKEERNASPAKPIVKILRKELKIVKSREGSGDRLDAKPASRHRSEVPVAAVPQGFYSLRYFMEYPRRGTAVIINNREFSMSNTPFRKGSDNDAQTLHKTMLQLGFKVEAWTDLSVKSMRDAVDYYATRIDHSDADCFFLAIFSHGEDGIIYGTDGKINLTDLTAPFRGDKSTTLAGKPKIFVIQVRFLGFFYLARLPSFFLQACRGDQLDSGVDLVEADAGSVYRIPAEADFLYAFSTPTGYFSWRNTELGSWFIQSLCRNLSEHAAHPDMDVLRLLTRVNYEVAMVNESNVPNDAKWHRKKQIPSVVSMLTKDLFFTPKSARH